MLSHLIFLIVSEGCGVLSLDSLKAVDTLGNINRIIEPESG